VSGSIKCAVYKITGVAEGRHLGDPQEGNLIFIFLWSMPDGVLPIVHLRELPAPYENEVAMMRNDIHSNTTPSQTVQPNDVSRRKPKYQCKYQCKYQNRRQKNTTSLPIVQNIRKIQSTGGRE
jgi:hypothetical protein